MKRFIPAVLAATLIACLTACGGGAQQTSSPGESASSSPTPTKKSRPVPDVAGKSYQDARAAMNKEGFYPVLIGKDGKRWGGTTPDPTLLAVFTKPAAGTVTDSADVEITVNATEAEFTAAAKAAADAAKAAAEGKKLATRYEFSCGEPGIYSSSPRDVYHSFREVWASKHYAGTDSCTITIDKVGVYDKPVLIPSEKAILDVVAAHGGDVSVPGSALGTVLDLCTKVPTNYVDLTVGRGGSKKADSQAALTLCPDAPHAAILQEAVTAVRVTSGTKVVGQTMEPGTYQTKAGAKDCYWSRTTGGGDIIANDFVGFAPNGVTVAVYPGEGFESEGCGVWTKVE